MGGICRKPLTSRAELISGSLSDVLASIHGKGHRKLYIDGGVTVQNILKEDLIDEMIITVLPILLGGGSPLFGELAEPMGFEHVKTEVMLNAMVENRYRRAENDDDGDEGGQDRAASQIQLQPASEAQIETDRRCPEEQFSQSELKTSRFGGHVGRLLTRSIVCASRIRAPSREQGARRCARSQSLAGSRPETVGKPTR